MNVHWLVVAAGNDTTIGSTTIPAWLGSMVTTVVLLLILAALNARLNRHEKLDNVAMVILAVIGVAGALVTTPWFSWLERHLQHAISSGTHAGGGGSTAVLVVTLVIAGIGAWPYFNNPGLSNLAILAVAALPLFFNKWLYDVAQNYMTHIGAPWFHGIVVAVQSW